MMEQAKAVAPATETNETDGGILYRARPHPLALLAPGVLLAAAILLAFLASHYVPGLGHRLGLRAETTGAFDAACRWLLAIVPGIIGLNLLATAVACRTTSYVVTGTRVVATSGLLRITGSTTYLAKVESVVRDQGPLERLCDTGTITLIGTGGFRDTLTHVRKFRRFAATLDATLAKRDA